MIRTALRAVPLTFLLPAVADDALADEFRLADGRVVVGTPEEKQGGKVIEITTRHGVVTVKAADIVGHRTEEDLRVALADLEKGRRPSAFTSYQLATTAHSYGLEPEMWRHLDDAMMRSEARQNAALTQRIQEFLATLEPEVLPMRWRRSSTKIRVREFLYRIRQGIEPAQRAAVVELLVREPGADDALRSRAREANRHDQRLVALEALQRRRQTKGNLAFVYRSAVLDRNPDVRATLCKLIQRDGQAEEAIDYLAPGLMHYHPKMRTRTAEAFAHIGDRAAAPLLVAAGPSAGRALADAGPGVRGHIAILQQESYMRDFDVEVASASFIADPKVDVVQSGVVLDTTVHAVTRQRLEIVRSYRSALQSIVGSDPGRDPDRWASWLAMENTKAEAADGTSKTASRGEAR